MMQGPKMVDWEPQDKMHLETISMMTNSITKESHLNLRMKESKLRRDSKIMLPKRDKKRNVPAREECERVKSICLKLSIIKVWFYQFQPVSS